MLLFIVKTILVEIIDLNNRFTVKHDSETESSAITVRLQLVGYGNSEETTYFVR